LWIRDSDDEVLDDSRSMDVCDIALAPGPLLSSTANDATVKYSCWQVCLYIYIYIYVYICKDIDIYIHI